MSRRRVNELINGRRAITPDTAVRLAMYFGNDAAFWMHLQVAWDMHAAVRASSRRGRASASRSRLRASPRTVRRVRERRARSGAERRPADPQAGD